MLFDAGDPPGFGQPSLATHDLGLSSRKRTSGKLGVMLFDCEVLGPVKAGSGAVRRPNGIALFLKYVRSSVAPVC